MKKIISVILISLSISEFVFAKTCFRESICIKEPEKGLYVIKIDTKEHSVRPYVIDSGLDTAENVFKNNDFYGVLNGGYFDFKNKKTVSFVVKDEQTILDPTKNENLYQNEGLKLHIDLIYNRGEIRRLDCNGKIKYDILKHYDIVKEGCKIVDSLQGGPILYPELKTREEFFVKKNAEGKVTRDAIQAFYKKPRTAVAIKDNDVYFIVATKDYPMSLDDLYQFSKKQHFEKVLNLDGGGSTSFTNDSINIKSEKNDTQRKVKSFLVIEDAKKVVK